MRKLMFLLALLAATAGCRAPYMSDYADMTVMSETFPPVGTPVAALNAWFDDRGYAPGPQVYQAEASLRRRPGDPLVYARQIDKSWWLTRARSVQDLCVTERTIYYRLDAQGQLVHAIQNHRSQC